MEYRRFGKTGIEVSAVGFGCWESSGDYGNFDESHIVDAVHLALDKGITLFDTAEGYGFGRSEALLGKALRGKRDQALIVTKVGIYREKGKWFRDASRQRILSSLETSLQALETDYVDVYLVHWPDESHPFDETMAVMEELRAQGKTRFIGVSNFSSEQIALAQRGGSIDVVQYGYHLFDRRLERFVFPTVQEHDFGLMTYGSLAHGLLTGAFTRDTRFPEDDWRHSGQAFSLPLWSPDVLPRNIDVVEELTEIAAEFDKSSAQLALRWVLSNPLVGVALVGFRHTDEVRLNLDGLDWTLDPAILERIQAIFDKHQVDTAPDIWVETNR